MTKKIKLYTTLFSEDPTEKTITDQNKIEKNFITSF